jgi:GDP-L-fucose synthase
MPTLVLGGHGMLGSALVRNMRAENIKVIAHKRSDCDLTDYWETYDYIKTVNPHTIYHAAGRVGGILANMTKQYDFLFDNLSMASNVIDSARAHNIRNFFYISSSCVYPANCKQPMQEHMIYDGYPEITNRGYALAKIVGMEMIKDTRLVFDWNYRTMIPCNLYGPNDDFSVNGHVLGSLIRKICDAKRNDLHDITIWGDGTARREFLHVDDCASAILYASRMMTRDDKSDTINIGSGKDISIMELAKLIQQIVGWNGEILCDPTKPTGMTQKLLDISYLNSVGWESNVSLSDGIKELVKEYNASPITQE